MTREPLPNRREGISFDFKHSNVHFTASVGFYPDGRPGEVFAFCHKTTSEYDLLARDAAIVLSFALQHGACIDGIRKALLRDRDDGPATLIGSICDTISAMGEAS
jgi:hypothetical protein